MHAAARVQAARGRAPRAPSKSSEYPLPRVTIGLPFFNASRTMAAAIRSVFAQSYSNWDLVLLDDGSTDDSLRQACAVRDSRSTVISDGANRGLSYRLNQIADMASGEFLARMDADDMMHPERLLRQVEFLRSNPDVDIVGTATYTIDGQRQPVGMRGHCPVDANPAQVLKKGLFVHPTVMARTAWAREHRYAAQYRRAEDHELWCRICERSKVGHLPEPLYFYQESVPINLRAYIDGCMTEREIIRQYGPEYVGALETRILLAGRFAKEWLYRWSETLGYQSFLVRRRNAPLDRSQREAARSVLSRINETPVPGLLAAESRLPERAARLLHMSTVPKFLYFMTGQPAFMREHGFQVEAVSSPGEDLDAFGRNESVPVHSVQMHRRISPLADLVCLARLCRLFKSDPPTIVHAHTPKAGFLGMLAGWLMRVPVRVYGIHGLRYSTTKGLRRSLLRLCELIACRAAHRVLSVSESLRTELITEGVCAPAKIRVLHHGSINGVDATGRFNVDPHGRQEMRTATRGRYGIPSDALVIGFVGRIVRDKGISELVEAWDVLRSRFANLHMLIVGPFEEEDAIPQELVLQLQEDHRIHLVGQDWETPPLYASMDVLVLPSYREGFSVVCIEAAAMGLPVVATRVTGCVDAIIDGRTGLLVPPRARDPLVEALSRYLCSGDLREAHGRAGRRMVEERFAQQELWAALAREYAELLPKRDGANSEEQTELRAMPGTTDTNA